MTSPVEKETSSAEAWAAKPGGSRRSQDEVTSANFNFKHRHIELSNAVFVHRY